MTNRIEPLDAVSRRRMLQASGVAIGSLGTSGVVAARGRGVTTESQDVLSQMPGEVDCPGFIEPEDTGRGVVSEGGATLRRTRNGISCQVRMPTPSPGEYIYPCPGPTATDVQGSPEAFTLWVFVFDDLDPEANWTGAFLGSGHLTGGQGSLTLSGHVSMNTDPFVGKPLSNPEAARVHLAVAPHGAIDSGLMPDQIKTPAGPGPYIWWVALFD